MTSPKWLSSRALIVNLNMALALINVIVIARNLYLQNYLIVELSSVVVFLLVAGSATTKRRLSILDHKIAKADAEREFAVEMYEKLKKAGPLGGMKIMGMPEGGDDEGTRH